MKRIEYFNKYWQKLNSLAPEEKEQVVDLGMGMPDPSYFEVPPILLKKLHESIDKYDFISYCRPEGNVSLLNEIAEYESRLAGNSNYTAKNIVMTPGAIAAFTIIVDTLLNREDEILIANPSYFSLVALAELKNPVVTIASDFLNSDVDFFKKSASPKTKLLFLCDPNNPTGLFIPPVELEKIIKMAQASGIYLVLDESCRNYIFSKANAVVPKNIAQKKVIRIKSFSKEQNLAGYRLGYILADDEIISKLKITIPALYGNPTVMADRALLAELQLKNGVLEDKSYDETIASNFRKMKQSRDLAFELLDKSGEIEKVVMPEACHHLFAKCRKGGNSLELFEQLVDEAKVDVCPGVLFGMPAQEAWVRICFARKPGILKDGINRMLEFLKSR